MEKFGRSRLAYKLRGRTFKSCHCYYPIGNILQKEVKTIVKITKNECFELQKMGHRFGSEGTLHRTYTKHHRYYMTESKKALADLDKIRKSHIVER